MKVKVDFKLEEYNVVSMAATIWNLTTTRYYRHDVGEKRENTYTVTDQEEVGLKADVARKGTVSSKYTVQVWPAAAASHLSTTEWTQQQQVVSHQLFISLKSSSRGQVLTPGRQLLRIDYFGSVFLPCGELHAPPHHRERAPTQHRELRVDQNFQKDSFKWSSY